MAQQLLTITPETSPDDASRRLERIEQNLERLASTLDQTQITAPRAMATAVDVVDEFLLTAQARGIDIDALLRAGGSTLGVLAELVQSPEFSELLRSGALSAGSVGVLVRAGDAMAETGAEAGGKAGILALLRATRDPEVQRALDFVLRFLKRFGRGLAEHDERKEASHA